MYVCMHVCVRCCQGYGIFSQKSGNDRVSTFNFESESFDFSIVINRRIGRFSPILVAENCIKKVKRITLVKLKNGKSRTITQNRNIPFTYRLKYIEGKGLRETVRIDGIGFERRFEYAKGNEIYRRDVNRDLRGFLQRYSHVFMSRTSHESESESMIFGIDRGGDSYA